MCIDQDRRYRRPNLDRTTGDYGSWGYFRSCDPDRLEADDVVEVDRKLCRDVLV
jgi:hypothetical protein